MNRLDKGKEPVPLPEVYEVDVASLKNGFSSRIEDIRARLAGAGVPDEELRSIAQEIAAYVEQRTREVEREDYFKAKESRERNRFSIYLEMILLWQKEKETQAKEFSKEQDDMLQSFRLSPTQIEQVNLYTQAILRDRVIKAVDANVIGEAKTLLTLKTEYLKTHGENLLGDIVDICDSWEQENLTYLANILNVIINEVVYSQHQDLLDHLLEISWAIGISFLI